MSGPGLSRSRRRARFVASALRSRRRSGLARGPAPSTPKADRQQERGRREHIHRRMINALVWPPMKPAAIPSVPPISSARSTGSTTSCQRNAATEKQARQHVPAEFVCSEPMALRADWRKLDRRARRRREECRSENRKDGGALVATASFSPSLKAPWSRRPRTSARPSVPLEARIEPSSTADPRGG